MLVSLSAVNSNQLMFEFGSIQYCFRPVQALQAGVLKVGAGYEKFGLDGKWLLHGPSSAKFDRTGSSAVIQRSLAITNSILEAKAEKELTGN